MPVKSAIVAKHEFIEVRVDVFAAQAAVTASAAEATAAVGKARDLCLIP